MSSEIGVVVLKKIVTTFNDRDCRTRFCHCNVTLWQKKNKKSRRLKEEVNGVGTRSIGRAEAEEEGVEEG